MEVFELTPGDKASGLWQRLKAHLEERLAYVRTQNDSSQTEAKTGLLRGEIQCLKRLIALGDDRPVLTGNDE